MQRRKKESKQTFLMCKSHCVCGLDRCAALGLKQCFVCHDVLKSVCSKSLCNHDKRPVMLLPAAAMTVGFSLSKQMKMDDTLELSDLFDFELMESKSENDEDEFKDDHGSNAPSNGGLNSPSNVLLETWYTLRPPVKEETIKGKWYGVLYSTKKSQALYIAKILRRFLADENGPVDCIEMRCLKPKVGSVTILHNTTLHLPDITSFPLCDIIYGLLEVVPLKGEKFNLPSYEDVVEQFSAVKSMDRQQLSL